MQEEGGRLTKQEVRAEIRGILAAPGGPFDRGGSEEYRARVERGEERRKIMAGEGRKGLWTGRWKFRKGGGEGAGEGEGE